MEDAPLDEFLDSGDDREGDRASDQEDDHTTDREDDHGGDADRTSPAGSEPSPGPTDRPIDPGDVDRTGVTVQWSPTGAVCPSCGTEVRRRWRSGEGFVCSECVDWWRDTR